MKKIHAVMVAFVGLVAMASVVMADSVTVTVSRPGAVGAGVAYSAPIPASGWLDRVEFISTSTGLTNTFTLATYEGTTAQQKFVEYSTTATGTQYKVVSPRITATTTAGVALAAVDGGTNSQTVLVAQYDRMIIGGNLKLAVSPALTNATTEVKAILYFDRNR
jgi:hypothetical protein